MRCEDGRSRRAGFFADNRLMAKLRDSGMKISGISAARRRIPPALRLRCREATAREGHCGGAVGFVLEVVAGGEVESCEGEVVAARDWHGACLPGRRSGNKGVGARWRGRFRIFSARHCSRTKVSHAENSGMTMLFFSWRLLRCRRGILSHPQERTARGVLVFFGDCSGVGVCVDHGSGHAAPCRLRRDGTRRFWFGGFFHMLGAWERHRIVLSAPPHCVLRSGASHSLQWGVMPALRRRFRIFSFRLREMKIPE